MKADVLIVGAGPAGLAAASSAREGGAGATIVDDNPTVGGQIWRGEDSHRPAHVEMLLSAGVISAEAGGRTLLVETSERAVEISYRKLILATGARELFLPFPGWTLPGVMGVGGLQALVKSGLPIAGKRVVIAGSGPLLLAAAAYLRKHGAKIKMICEQAPRGAVARFALLLLRSPGKLAQAARLQVALAGVPYRFGTWVEAAEGPGCVERLRLRHEGRSWIEYCDYGAVAYGLYPNTEPASLIGCSIEDGRVAVDELQRTSMEDVFCAGEATGIGGLELSMVEGEIAGHAAAGALDRARKLFSKRHKARRFARELNDAFVLRNELRGLAKPETIVCRCEDVSFQKLQEMTSFRAAKLHTRCGMGPCQGRVCGPAVEFLFGWKTGSVRPPVFPARVETMAAWEAAMTE